MPSDELLNYVAVLGQKGGYCTFMGNVTMITMITQTAISNFFTINSRMLTFHKHPLLS